MRAGRRISWERSPAWGNALGALCYRAMPRYRRVALANLRLAFGREWDEARIHRVARASFGHLATTMVEFFLHQPRWTAADVDRWLRWDGREHLDAALARGRGVILVMAHYGNWELFAPLLGRWGYPVHAIAREADDPGLNGVIQEIRTRWGAQVYSRRQGPRRALAVLRANELLVMHLDQNHADGGVFVDFFGHPAATATGAARLAHRTGAALVCAFGIRQPDRTYRMRFLPALLADGDAPVEAEIVRLTAELTRRIEAQIVAAPEQWWWLHNRWKRRAERIAAAGDRRAATSADRS